MVLRAGDPAALAVRGQARRQRGPGPGRALAGQPAAGGLARNADLAGPRQLLARGRGDPPRARGHIPTSILEIGGGYGRTAYSLLGIFPEASYTIIDIEPALSISRFYLTSLYPERDITWVDARELDTLTATPDLALAISSLHEMTPEQVGVYLDLLDTIVPDGGTVFLKQWEQWNNPTDDVVMTFDDYPVPAGWQTTFRETAPVQTKFRQAAWQVGPHA